nr:MAG TPA: Cro/C1-type HTH DNA-binding domain protein [Caudoviricetes sp.]
MPIGKVLHIGIYSPKFEVFLHKFEDYLVFKRNRWYNYFVLVCAESEDGQMGVSYKKLFKLLIDRGMKKKDLQEAAGLSPAAVTKLAKDEYVRLDVLVRVCCALDVDIGDIMEVTKEE